MSFDQKSQDIGRETAIHKSIAQHYRSSLLRNQFKASEVGSVKRPPEQCLILTVWILTMSRVRDCKPKDLKMLIHVVTLRHEHLRKNEHLRQ